MSVRQKKRSITAFFIPAKNINACGINVEYMYSVMGKVAGRADIVIRVEDVEKASKVLIDNGVTLIEKKDLCK